MTSFHVDPSLHDDKGKIKSRIDCIVTYLEENRQNIFYLFVFYIITIALFVHQFICKFLIIFVIFFNLFIKLVFFTDYSFLAEHTDLRHIMGVGIALTRGSAASLSFGYCLLLLTMSRNLLTKLKDFSIQQYIPLDSHIPFHKVIACTSFFFSIIHTIGHIINFYHVSTQPLENLHCLTSEIHFPSDYKPGISFWLFKTITGMQSYNY